jgi:hypothetical protein
MAGSRQRSSLQRIQRMLRPRARRTVEAPAGSLGERSRPIREGRRRSRHAPLPGLALVAARRRISRGRPVSDPLPRRLQGSEEEPERRSDARPPVLRRRGVHELDRQRADRRFGSRDRLREDHARKGARRTAQACARHGAARRRRSHGARRPRLLEDRRRRDPAGLGRVSGPDGRRDGSAGPGGRCRIDGRHGGDRRRRPDRRHRPDRCGGTDR